MSVDVGIVINILSLIIIGLISFFAKLSLSEFRNNFDKQFDFLKEVLTEIKVKVNNQNNEIHQLQNQKEAILKDIAKLVSDLDNLERDVKGKFDVYDTNIRKFYEKYQSTFDFVKENLQGLQKMITQNSN